MAIKAGDIIPLDPKELFGFDVPDMPPFTVTVTDVRTVYYDGKKLNDTEPRTYKANRWVKNG